MRTRLLAGLTGLLAVAAAGVVPALAGGHPASARATRAPTIKAAEVGYFGSALVTRSVSVFVYSDVGPSAGNRVTVCLDGRCQRAVGHDARLAWYEASFTTSSSLRMGAHLSFTAVASDSAGKSQIRVTRPLLCMHNNGSTPQTS